MEKLKKQKAKLLDDVMETETYKVAKELLDDFATDAEKRQLNVRLFLDASMLSRFKELIDLVLRNRFLDCVSRKSSCNWVKLDYSWPNLDPVTYLDRIQQT